MKRAVRIIPLLVLLVSCQNEQEDPTVSVVPVPTQEESEVFFGTTEEGPDTKAYVDADLYVRWNADDRVSIFAKNDASREYRFTGETGNNAGTFERVDTENAAAGQALTYNYAVYPYSQATTISTDGVLTVTLPAEQAYKENSFGLGASTMVAVSETNNLLFKNAGTFVAVQVYGEGISVSRMTIRGRNGEKLAGQAAVTMVPEGTPGITMATENVSETVTLVCESPVAVGTDAAGATAFWFVLPPTIFTKGFLITVEDSAGNFYEQATSREITFGRSVLTRMAAFELVPRGFGLYPVSGGEYVYDPTTDQMNVYEAEGSGWFRYLAPGLKVWQLGPIPLDVAEGTTINNVTLTVSTAGNQDSSKSYETLTVRSFRNGILTLASEAGDQFVIRF